MSEIDAEKTRKIVAKNPFFAFRGALSEMEGRLLWLLIANVDSIASTKFDWVYWMAPELAKIVGLQKEGQGAFDYLRAVGEALQGRVIRIPNPEDMKNEEFSVGMLSMVRARKSDLRLGFKIHPDLAPYLLQIKKDSGFTQVDFQTMISLSGEYSGRIFANLLAERWKSPNSFKWTISVLDLRKMFELEKQYPDFKDLRKRVIDPIVPRLKEKVGWSVEVSILKKGQTPTHVVFSVRPDRPAEPPKKPKTKKIDRKKAVQSELFSEKRSAEELEKALEKHPELILKVAEKEGEIINEDSKKPWFSSQTYDPAVARLRALEEFEDLLFPKKRG